MTHNAAAGYAGKGLLAVVPALLSAYLSYHTAKVDADVEIARIHAKAAVGYETLVTAVKTLETTVGELNTRLAALERPAAPAAQPVRRLPPVMPPAAKNKVMFIPKTLDDAAMAKGL